MQVVIRVDSSLQIGTGHVMRCLTLADRIGELGGRCTFVMRDHPGNVSQHVQRRGHGVKILPRPGSPVTEAGGSGDHRAWLGIDFQVDLSETADAVAEQQWDWLVVDHYAIDCRWETGARRLARRLLAIDDLIDRQHDCDVLVDQTLGRDPREYRGLVPEHCALLCGAAYAMLRPQFAACRAGLSKLRRMGFVRQVLLTMGGVDAGNMSGAMLDAMERSELPRDVLVHVVLGPSAPWYSSVLAQAGSMSLKVVVHRDVSDMAHLMASCDLAIGAAGSTAWERCCMGLPSILVVLAANQRGIANALEAAGAAWVLELGGDLQRQLNDVFAAVRETPQRLSLASERAALIVDGRGVDRVAEAMRTAK